MKLYAVRIFVHDFEKACAFYRDTLGLDEHFLSDEMGWAQYAVGAPCLGIERVEEGDEERTSLVGRFVGASLEVEDIQATYEELQGRGVKFTYPPTRQPRGGVLASFEDPAGNTLTLLRTPH